MSSNVEILVIGAGASGLMLSSLLKRKSSVMLIDGNPKIGAKIAVSGGGRCNFCNEKLSVDHYRTDPRFVGEVFRRYGRDWLLDWAKKRGLALRNEKEGQFFCTRGAQSLNEIFHREIRGVDLHLQTRVQAVSGRGPFVVETDRGSYRARKLVVASGGLSFPRLGANDLGLQIAREYGHSVLRPAPALVGLTLQPPQFFMKELSGISLPVEIRVASRRIRGDLLFAHRGISGPVVLNASLWWDRGEIEIDFLPDFDEKRLKGSKHLSTLLPLPKRVAKAFLEHLEIEDTPAAKMGPATHKKLQNIRRYRFAPAGTFGYARAEVTKGGVSTEEVDPHSMESCLVPGLYFLGEVLDVTGELGGYNFQWAFSSAAVCADALNAEV